MSLPRVLITVIPAALQVTPAEVERIASQRGYIVANARPLNPQARVSYLDGRPADIDPDTQMWISDIVVAEYDGQESA